MLKINHNDIISSITIITIDDLKNLYNFDFMCNGNPIRN